MKLVISTIVSAVVLLLLAFLFYSVVFAAGYMGSFAHIMRGESDPKLWANIVGTLFQGFFLSLVYKMHYKGVSPFKEGFTFGILMGLLLSVPYVFFMWANYLVRYYGVILDGVGMGFRILVACIIIGLIFGKKEVKQA